MTKIMIKKSLRAYITSCEVELFGDPYGNRTAEILSKYYNFLYYRRFFTAVMEIFYFMRKKSEV